MRADEAVASLGGGHFYCGCLPCSFTI